MTARRTRLDRSWGLFLGGRFTRPSGAGARRVTTPNGGDMTWVARATESDLHEAVRAGRRALSAWSDRGAEGRGRALLELAERLERRSALLVEGLVEAGWTRAAAEADVETAVDRTIAMAGWADKFAGMIGGTDAVGDAGVRATVAEPCGVVAVLAPRSPSVAGWLRGLLPVVVSGNSAVVIVETEVPVAILEATEALALAGWPEGTASVLTAARDDLLGALATHEDLDAVSAFDATPDELARLRAPAPHRVGPLRVVVSPRSIPPERDDETNPYWILPFVSCRTVWHAAGR